MVSSKIPCFGFAPECHRKSFTRCWETNKSQLIDRLHQYSVLLRLNHELRDTADEFPTLRMIAFYDMQIYIGYLSKRPNKILYDTLAKDVVNMMNKWYWGLFVRIKVDTIPIYAKVTLNRRIPSENRMSGVRVIITDMIAERRKQQRRRMKSSSVVIALVLVWLVSLRLLGSKRAKISTQLF